MSQKILTPHLKAHSYGSESLLQAPFIKCVLLYDGNTEGPWGFLCKVITSKGENFNRISATWSEYCVHAFYHVFLSLLHFHNLRWKKDAFINIVQIRLRLSKRSVDDISSRIVSNKPLFLMITKLYLWLAALSLLGTHKVTAVPGCWYPGIAWNFIGEEK